MTEEQGQSVDKLITAPIILILQLHIANFFYILQLNYMLHSPPMGDLNVFLVASEQPQYVQALTLNSMEEYGLIPWTSANDGASVRYNVPYNKCITDERLIAVIQ